MDGKSSFEREMDAVVAARHGDSFGFLGPHEEAGRLVIRTMQPGTIGVTVIDAATGEPLARLSRLHGDGFFAGPVVGRKGSRLDYRFDVEDGNGNVRRLDDPFRYPPVLGDLDLHLFGEGRHLSLYRRLGAQVTTLEGANGVSFAVWAPNASRVAVVGDFNNWDGRVHPMRLRHGVGLWEIFIPGLAPGALYKYEIKDKNGRRLPLKADPFGFAAETPPGTASRVWDMRGFAWTDAEWMTRRGPAASRDAPLSIYEVHLGSWRRKEGGRFLTYRELAEELGAYVHDMGFSHVELLPVHEHPFSGSWGYQPIGLFAPTSRFGTPDDFRFFVDSLHRQGIGVIIDWVAGHFPSDTHGLGLFDGTHLYEHADPRQGMHKDWNTLIFNYGRREVANYLLANALFWLDACHVDGLRVDAVASMLYLDYSRRPGEWIPNRFGGNENLEAVAFLKDMNRVVHGAHPDTVTIAEESTAWPMVTRPVHLGGLGFDYKWNMGWMHDTLRYIGKDPVHRRFHHKDLTFGLLYAFQENFVLPLSHDEMVHGKRSLLGRMPGDRWRRFANLRAYLAFMFAHPGKKLLFMGAEFGQDSEWNAEGDLEWNLLDDPMHRGIRDCVRELNRLFHELAPLHERDCEGGGFSWIDCNDADDSVVSWIRMARDPDDAIVAVVNFTPVVRADYRVGVPWPGWYREILNTDSRFFGGSDVGLGGGIAAEDVPWHGHDRSLRLRLPPLAALYLRPGGR